MPEEPERRGAPVMPVTPLGNLEARCADTSNPLFDRTSHRLRGQPSAEYKKATSMPIDETILILVKTCDWISSMPLHAPKRRAIFLLKAS
ncbi:hypothetical protein [Caballeronia sp. LZ035]|uniref:hypothetical protein n=1 Tax=Caballeronia sp. LZ035 TaxID=3038568 RepID=UPI002856E07B|nr:hypothetical protein [Caballeronia sp. LZ035]MDR5760236.1 hypothetical protein [Caballeronia sp. LZ035]